MKRIQLIPVHDECVIGFDNTQHTLCADMHINGNYVGSVSGTFREILNPDNWRKSFGYATVGQVTKNQLEEIKDSLYLQLEEVETEYIYSYLGWSKDFSYYLFSKYKVDAESITHVENGMTVSKIVAALSGRDNEICKYVYSMSSRLTKRSVYAKMLICVRLLSMYTSYLQQKADVLPSFVVYVAAESGSKKTSALMPLLNPSNEKTCSFEDTQAALTTVMKEQRDTLLIIDDMSKSRRDGMIPKTERIVRLAGDKTTTAYKMRGGKVDDSVIQCLSLMIGEEIPRLQDSSYPRMLIAELDNDEVNMPALTELQSRTEDLMWFYMLFLQFSMCEDNFIDNLISSFMSYRRKYRQKLADYNIHGRYVDMCAWIVTMWDMLVKFYQKYGIDTSEDDFVAQYEQVILAQAHKYTPKSPAMLFAIALKRMMENNELAVISYDSAKRGKDFDVVKKDDDTVLIKSFVVYDKIVRWYRSHNIDFDYSERAVRADLYKKGLLFKQGEYNTFEIKDVNNKRQECTRYFMKT